MELLLLFGLYVCTTLATLLGQLPLTTKMKKKTKLATLGALELFFYDTLAGQVFCVGIYDPDKS